MNEIKDNPLYISWCDSAWLPLINPSTVLDYFSERSNPFYDRTCNNEIVKMQRLSVDQLSNMQGIEYILLHVQEPILYVIRKQHRHSPSQVTPIADYYIIAGTVYQAPDLMSIINFRILSAVHHLQSAFDEANSYSRYHPSKGYWWEFSKDNDKDNSDKLEKSSKDKTKEEAVSSTKFQRKRVDILLSELAKKFPPKLTQPQSNQNLNEKQANALVTNNTEIETKPEIKVEKSEASANQSSINLANNVSNFRSSLAADKKQRIS